MSRTIRNVGPALAALVVTVIATGALTMATSSAATPPPEAAAPAAAAPTSTMLNKGIYGTGIGYDTKANVPIGPDGQKMAIRFKATSSSALNSVRFVQRGGPGYSLGNGGTITLSVQADDGAGHPSGTSLAAQSITPGNPSGAWETYKPVDFASPATLKAGSTYYIVFTNPSTTNTISVNCVYVYSGSTPRQPMYADADYGLMYTTGSWGALQKGFTPVVDLTYANGGHDGQSYYEAMIDKYNTISGTSSMAREHFTVSGGDRTVKSASVRLRRSSGTSPLTLTLETSAGAAIESATVPAASVPVSSPGGDNGGAVWVTANFTTPRVLSDGVAYNLRVSTASGTTYTTFPVRSGLNKGLTSYTFSGGSGQFTTNGSTWADTYAFDHEDMQFYFALAAGATPPTTTTPPPTTSTTTATTPPTTTTTTTAPGVAPDWQSSQTPAGAVGVDYSFQYDANGTPEPTYALTSGLLPPGLTLTPAGVLAGKPTTAGSFTFTVSAQNGVAPDAVRARTIVISPAAPPTTTTPPPTTTTTAPGAVSLQCPVVVSPTVGQTVVCTYR